MVASNPVDAVDPAVSDGWMRKQIDYRTARAGQSYTKYINLGKFYSKMGHKWKDVTEQYPAAHTMFRIPTMGYGNGDAGGHMTITWYVAF